MFKFISKHSKKALLAVELCAVNALLVSNTALAVTDISGIATKANTAMNAVKTSATLLCGVVGLIMVGNSLNNLYKASKDPSHQVKPMAGIVGLIMGGLLASVAVVVAVMQTSAGVDGGTTTTTPVAP
jgi:hypothetical protein